MKFRDSSGRENYEIPVSNGVVKPPHVRQIRPAYALFLKLEDMVTDGEGADGLVLGGSAIRDERLAKELGLARRTVNDHRQRLQKYRYIAVRETEAGFLIRVRKSRKWEVIQRGRRRSASGENPPEAGEISPTSGENPPGIGRQHQGHLQRQQQTDATAAPECWEAVGVSLPIGPAGFQSPWGFLYAQRNGHPLSEAMERTIQAWQLKGRKVPPPFFEAKRAVEALVSARRRSGCGSATASIG